MPPSLADIPLPLTSLWFVSLTSLILYLAARCVYLLYFHPLASIPGPKVAALTDFWYGRNSVSGRACFSMRELHRKYGDVIRVGPNRLSFCTPQAYLTIYGHVKHGADRFLKSEWYEVDLPRITNIRDPVFHGQQRRAMSHAFSARALRDQEDVIHLYVDKLMAQLGKLGKNGQEAVDATDAWNWLTFDVIGDLALGEPFNSIDEASNEWMVLIFSYLQYLAHARIARGYGHFGPIYLKWHVTPAIQAAVDRHHALTTAKAERRIAKGDMNRVDFFSHLLRMKVADKEQLVGDTSTLVIAGSETTATTLCGLTYYLLKNPDCFQKLAHEIRGAFTSMSEITGDATASLPYLHGCIEEALRLFPPVAVGLPRDCPGATIDGVYVPKGTIVHADALSMSTHPRFWTYPNEFRPERWVGDGFKGDDKRASQPFSLGPRGCLGVNMAYLELRIAAAKVVWMYDLEMASEIASWHDACVDMGLWKKPEFLVKFHPRAAV